MEISYRTNFFVARLAMAIVDMVSSLIRSGFEDWNNTVLTVDNELNVSFISVEEAIKSDKFEYDMLLNNFINSFYEDNTQMIEVNIEKCEKLADRYAPLIEYGVIRP